MSPELQRRSSCVHYLKEIGGYLVGRKRRSLPGKVKSHTTCAFLWAPAECVWGAPIPLTPPSIPSFHQMREKDPFNPYLVKSIPENEFPHTLTYRYGTLECSYLGWTERFGTIHVTHCTVRFNVRNEDALHTLIHKRLIRHSDIEDSHSWQKHLT